MLKSIKNNRAQALMGEYLLVFLIIIGMISAMSIYFRRSIQARLRDAEHTNVRTVYVRTQNFLTANVVQFAQYEPYYAQTNALVDRSSNMTERLVESPGFSSGIFRKESIETTISEGAGVTAPPRDAD